MGNKRKALLPLRELISPKATVEPLRIEEMTLYLKGASKLHFKRLKYKGCPRLTYGTNKFPVDIELVDMERDSFIRDCYQEMVSDLRPCLLNHFNSLTHFIQWLDEALPAINCDEYLSNDVIDTYMQWCDSQVKLGNFSKVAFSQRKGAISWLLKRKGRLQDAELLQKIKGLKTTVKHHKSLDIGSELKLVTKSLFRAYKKLLDSYENNTALEVHPLYDKGMVEQYGKDNGLTEVEVSRSKAAFKKALHRSHPNNHIVRVAMMITYVFTGMNATPLARLKMRDVVFKEVQGGTYVLNSVKGRANYQEQDNSLGFSKYAKSFIEGWLFVAKSLNDGCDAGYLFPYFNLDGHRSSYADSVQTPQHCVNKMLVKLGLPKVTPSILRKTKSDALFRVTESVYLVAMTNNNSIHTTARTYIHGTEKEHEKNLNAAMSAKHALAKGVAIDEAVESSKYEFSDVLDDYEYRRLRQGQDRSHEALTPSGVRCNDSRKGAAKVIERTLGKLGVRTKETETVCTDFLACFECQEHSFVAAVDDIWLMLSFKETLQQLQQLPAVNSMPEDKYSRLFKTVGEVLDAYKLKSPSNYNSACEKLREASHPLYSNIYSLNDLLEVFS